MVIDLPLREVRPQLNLSNNHLFHNEPFIKSSMVSRNSPTLKTIQFNDFNDEERDEEIMDQIHGHSPDGNLVCAKCDRIG